MNATGILVTLRFDFSLFRLELICSSGLLGLGRTFTRRVYAKELAKKYGI